MAQGREKGDLFIRRVGHLNLAFLTSITVLFLVEVALYKFFSMPVSSRLVLYVYSFQLLSALIAYGVSYIIRRRMLPIKTSEPFWSYVGVRRYFWSYVLLSIPFSIAFIFYIFAGNLSSLFLGYILSLCGLIVFRPRKGDVV